MDEKTLKQVQKMIDAGVKKGIDEFKKSHRISLTSHIVDTATDAGAVVNKRQALGITPTDKLGYYGAIPVAKQTVTGSRGANAALTSLLIALANLGFVVNSSS